MNSIHIYNKNNFIFKSLETFFIEHQKKIGLVALAIIACFATYFMIRKSWHQSKPVHQLNNQSQATSNFPPPMQGKHRPRSYVSLKHLHANQSSPLYDATVEQFDGKQSLYPWFNNIINYRTVNGMIEFLITYQSTGDPQVKAIWDDNNHKLYLTGGKHDPGSQRGLSWYPVPENQAWVRVDLHQIPYKGIIPIYGKHPGFQAGSPPVQHGGPSEEFFISIDNQDSDIT